MGKLYEPMVFICDKEAFENRIATILNRFGKIDSVRHYPGHEDQEIVAYRCLNVRDNLKVLKLMLCDISEIVELW